SLRRTIHHRRHAQPIVRRIAHALRDHARRDRHFAVLLDCQRRQFLRYTQRRANLCAPPGRRPRHNQRQSDPKYHQPTRHLYPPNPASADLPSTYTAHGSNTAVSAPPIDSFFPPAAFSPNAISTIAHSTNRSSELASDSRNLLAVEGSMNAPGLKTSGFCKWKSSGDFRNITTIVRIPPIACGSQPHDTAANACLSVTGADMIPFTIPSATPATIRNVSGVPKITPQYAKTGAMRL